MQDSMIFIFCSRDYSEWFVEEMEEKLKFKQINHRSSSNSVADNGSRLAEEEKKWLRADNATSRGLIDDNHN